MRIVFMGTPLFALAPLSALHHSKHEIVAVFAQPDKPQGRKQIIQKGVVHQFCSDHDLPIFMPTKLKDGQVAEQIRKLQPDLLITAAYGRILPKEILDIPRLGCINLHGSLLPAYRGASPIQEALMRGDKVTGVSILRMVEAMDAGAVLCKAPYEIQEDDDVDSLMVKLSELGAEALLPLMDELESGTVQEEIQDEAQATYVGMITKERGLLDFEGLTASEVYALYQGTKPWPGIYAFLKEKRIKLLEISKKIQVEDEKLQLFEQEALPGQAFCYQKKRLFVKCKSGLIEILSLQLEGQKALEAKVCAHNYHSAFLSSAPISKEMSEAV